MWGAAACRIRIGWVLLSVIRQTAGDASEMRTSLDIDTFSFYADATEQMMSRRSRGRCGPGGRRQRKWFTSQEILP